MSCECALHSLVWRRQSVGCAPASDRVQTSTTRCEAGGGASLPRGTSDAQPHASGHAVGLAALRQRFAWTPARAASAVAMGMGMALLLGLDTAARVSWQCRHTRWKQAAAARQLWKLVPCWQPHGATLTTPVAMDSAACADARALYAWRSTGSSAVLRVVGTPSSRAAHLVHSPHTRVSSLRSALQRNLFAQACPTRTHPNTTKIMPQRVARILRRGFRGTAADPLLPCHGTHPLSPAPPLQRHEAACRRGVSPARGTDQPAPTPARVSAARSPGPLPLSP